MKANAEFRLLKPEPSTYTTDGKTETKTRYRLYLSDEDGAGMDLRISEIDAATFSLCRKGDDIIVDLGFKDAQAAMGGGRGTYAITQLSGVKYLGHINPDVGRARVAETAPVAVTLPVIDAPSSASASARNRA